MSTNDLRAMLTAMAAEWDASTGDHCADCDRVRDGLDELLAATDPAPDEAPSFVRTLTDGTEPVAPVDALALDPEVKADLDRQLAEMDRARRAAAANAANYVIGAAPTPPTVAPSGEQWPCKHWVLGGPTRCDKCCAPTPTTAPEPAYVGPDFAASLDVRAVEAEPTTVQADDADTGACTAHGERQEYVRPHVGYVPDPNCSCPMREPRPVADFTDAGDGGVRLTKKWREASKVARKSERHWPADCLAEAADTYDRLTARLAEVTAERDRNHEWWTAEANRSHAAEARLGEGAVEWGVRYGRSYVVGDWEARQAALAYLADNGGTLVTRTRHTSPWVEVDEP